MTKKPIQNSTVRSSAAECRIFVVASGQGNVEAIYANEDVRFTQKMTSTRLQYSPHGALA